MGNPKGKEDQEELLRQLEWLESGSDTSGYLTQSALGLACTTAALSMGLKEFLKGDSLRAQLVMRYRVGMQAVTVFSMVAGVYYDTHVRKYDPEKENEKLAEHT